METLTVLVVDDEPGMRLGVARALRDFTVQLPDVNGPVGFLVEQAASGEEALARIGLDGELAKTTSGPAALPTPVDILLLDHKLPGISGLDVLAAVADKPSDILTVMITAYATLDTAIAATKRGAYDFLAKPFTPDELKSTIRKAAGRQILARQARRLSQEKRQVRFQFISVLAHELKAPLNAIEGYLNIMRERSAGDDPAVYERMIDRSVIRAQHMRKLISDLLDMTRIESGQMSRELADVDLGQVARSAIELAGPAAAEKGVRIELEAVGSTPSTLLADRGEIEMILNNLLSNAIKYNRAGGQVRVKLSADESAATIEVADSGIGLSSEEIGRLFTDFYRAHNERTRGILGSGLGLSIVKKLALLYNGEVIVRSQPEAGSTFTVVLKR